MITARVIADSIYKSHRITTMELEYPRFIHSEFMTHRLFSRNAASSRAIPQARVIEQIRTNHASPIHWGANQSGMQANHELSGIRKWFAKIIWRSATKLAVFMARLMGYVGLHKQVANRILEPFQHIKVVVTATEWENFFWLRDHKDAQPEIQLLAKRMKDAMVFSKPKRLKVGEWHLPYVSDEEVKRYGVEKAKQLSASLCAQASYRSTDRTMEKAQAIYKRLISGSRVHASPFEHQATPATKNTPHGVTHTDTDGVKWSGNFKGWVQHRQQLKGHVKW